MNTRLFLCMKWGTRYGPEYVNRLYRALNRNMKAPFELVCFTDDATGLESGVRALALPPFAGVPEPLYSKPWKKLSLWMAGLGQAVGAPELDGRQAVFLDIDLVVVADLSPLFEAEPAADFVVWRNPTKPNSGVGNTSIFRFTIGSHPEIYERFMADPKGLYENEFRIEQEYISARLGDGTAARESGRSPRVAELEFYRGLGVQRYFPSGLIVSFKEDVLPGWPMRFWQVPQVPAGACVVVFHGKPDPDEARDGAWPARGWKKLYKHVRPVPWIAENWG